MARPDVASTRSRPAPAPRRVTILGSTGSVGVNTIDLLERHPESFAIEALTAFGNVHRLVEQSRRLRPRLAVIGDPTKLGQLRDGLAGTGVEAAAGPQAIVEAASRPSDWVMAAIVGAAGLEPTMAAVRRGAVVGLANKECLVCAGDLMAAEIARGGATLLPVDSEHSAIFQVFDFEHRDKVEKIILTASGGPFRDMDRAAMKDVTPAQAVAHPNWRMGAKISVDSATMMNKGLEVIEAHYLFGLDNSRIEIVVHPQSVVHSLVAYIDGSVLAQLGSPDMRTPIAYALSWPDRMAAPSARLDLAAIGSLTFEPPDPERFPALRLARDALQAGGGAPIVLNAANEIAVAAFLGGKTGFLDIARIVQETLAAIAPPAPASLADVHDIDRQAREHAATLLRSN